MLDKIIHVNSNGETLDFFSLGIYVNYNDLRDYEWQVKSNNDKITGFYKGIVNKTIPFVFYVNENKANEIKNKFYEHFEIDVLRQSKGYFEINGYKYYCYVIKSVKSDYLIDKKLLYIQVETTTDDSYWIKETTKTINFSELDGSTDSLKYAFTYSFVYRGLNSVNIMNDNFIETDGIIRIYGNAINPLVKIGENIYQVNDTLDDNEYLEIDTKEKTIYKYSSYGDKTNIFHLRNKEYDVFKPIPSGQVNVSANAGFKVDIVMIERRGEPKWI
jgi:hypothetical protein